MFSTASASSSSALLFRQQQQQQQQQHRRAMESASGGGGGGGGGGQQQHQTKKKQQQQQQKQQQAAPGKRCLSLDETLGCIFEHLRDPDDRRNISLVSKQWHRVDGETRKYVSVSNCYSIAPSALSKRFKNLESFKLKGKPRAVEFDLLVDNWGGYAGPWIQELVKAYPSLKHLHLHRMEVLDTDLELLAHGCGAALQVRLYFFSFPPFVSLAPFSLLQPILPGYCTRVLSFLSFLLRALTDGLGVPGASSFHCTDLPLLLLLFLFLLSS
jgi:hypothetical protein